MSNSNFKKNENNIATIGNNINEDTSSTLTMKTQKQENKDTQRLIEITWTMRRNET